MRGQVVRERFGGWEKKTKLPQKGYAPRLDWYQTENNKVQSPKNYCVKKTAL